MAASLLKIAFDESLLPFVLDFDCRESRERPPFPWEADINEWIRMDPTTKEGARYRMKKGGCKVWLYVLDKEDGKYDVVGYGSLACSKWPDATQALPEPNLPRVPISLISAVGIQTPFQGGPPSASANERYSTQILQHLIFEARQKVTERQPFLGLYVHPDNERAIKFYKNNGFIDFHQIWHDDQTGTVYRSMILELRLLSRRRGT